MMHSRELPCCQHISRVYSDTVQRLFNYSLYFLFSRVDALLTPHEPGIYFLLLPRKSSSAFSMMGSMEALKSPRSPIPMSVSMKTKRGAMTRA